MALRQQLLGSFCGNCPLSTTRIKKWVVNVSKTVQEWPASYFPNFFNLFTGWCCQTIWKYESVWIIIPKYHHLFKITCLKPPRSEPIFTILVYLDPPTQSQPIPRPLAGGHSPPCNASGSPPSSSCASRCCHSVGGSEPTQAPHRSRPWAPGPWATSVA